MPVKGMFCPLLWVKGAFTVLFTYTEYAQCLHIGHHVPVVLHRYLLVLLLLFGSHRLESHYSVYLTNGCSVRSVLVHFWGYITNSRSAHYSVDLKTENFNRFHIESVSYSVISKHHNLIIDRESSS